MIGSEFREYTDVAEVTRQNKMEISEDASRKFDALWGDDKRNTDAKNYFDDNGKLYRVENDLAPNAEYEINGYKYKTDDQGRIVTAEGTLHMKEREGRLPIKDSIEDIGKDSKECMMN